MKKIGILFLLLGVIGISSCDLMVIELDEPTNVVASTSYSLKVELSWDNVDNADGYNIYRAEGDYYSDPETLSYVQVGSTSDNYYEDMEVSSSSTYYYQIEAYSDDDTSPMSTPVMGITVELTVEEAFDALAELTDGTRYTATSATEVPTIIINIIEDNAVSNADIVFLIDNTGSMWDDIDEVKLATSNIMASLPSGTRVGAAVYNDANEDPTGWYDYTDLTSNYPTTTAFIDGISTYGGGDLPESVYDGIYNVVDDMSWSSSSQRFIIVIGDAPPLEGSYTTYSLDDVISKCTSAGISVNLYPILIDPYGYKNGQPNQ